MANYSQFLKVHPDSIPSNTITDSKLQYGFGATKVFWVFNERAFCCDACVNGESSMCADGTQANGKCCLWTVPDKVSRATFEVWSGGGGGSGMNCCCFCSWALHGAGGNYAIKTISTTPGCQYTICAGGVWPCIRSYVSVGGQGCASFVTGYNLSNFCAVGGCGGITCNGDAYCPCVLESCANCNICGIYGADFGIMGSTGMKIGHGSAASSGTVCTRSDASFTGMAPLIGKMGVSVASQQWYTCGCFVNWPSGGGYSGISSYCGDNLKCFAAGNYGGSGVVRITYA